MKPEWLERSMIIGPYYTLCLNQAELDAEARKLSADPMVFPKSDASTWLLTSAKTKRCAIVCLADWKGKDPIVVAGLLVHEATHIWQNWCDGVGESNPGNETEAYAIQWMSQQLMWEFVRRTKRAR